MKNLKSLQTIIRVIIFISLIMFVISYIRDKPKDKVITFGSNYDYKHQREYFKNLERSDSIIQTIKLYKNEHN